MKTNTTHTLIVSYDGHSWHAVDGQDKTIALTSDKPFDEPLNAQLADDLQVDGLQADGLQTNDRQTDDLQGESLASDIQNLKTQPTNPHAFPDLPSGAVVSTLLLPVELLLSRTFSLPFSSTKFIDQEILAQELEEHTVKNTDAWWLAWQAAQDETGVSGMMFGLAESFRQQIIDDTHWQDVPTVTADVWVRLNAQLQRNLETTQIDESVAVLNTDSSGIFFGVWHTGKTEATGFWLGMRRLNWGDNALSEDQYASLAENIKRSLQAMGWQEAVSKSVGNLPVGLHEALNLSSWHGEVLELSNIASRHDSNLAMVSAAGLNFRHADWRVQSQLGQVKQWYRSMALAAVLVTLWTAGMMWQNAQLNNQLEIAQQRVITAFHQGLPDETVLIDALAQLRKAAGSGAQSKGSSDALFWLQQVEAINRVYQETAWKMKQLSFNQGEIAMSGQAMDMQSMNKIRQMLQQETGKKVRIEDTDLSGTQVKFKMVWS